MKLFIEIGNTNIKYGIDNQAPTLLLAKLENLQWLLNQYEPLVKRIFILANNVNLHQWILDHHSANPKYCIFNPKKHMQYLPKLNGFNTNELGHDLWMIMVYLTNNSIPNILVVSHGTCLVYVLKQDGKINDLVITMSHDAQCNYFKHQFGWLITNNYNNKKTSIKTTDYCVQQGIKLNLVGTINYLTSCWKSINNFTYIFCGNGFNLEQQKYLKKQYSSIIFNNHLVFEVFREWCNENLIKTNHIFI